MKRIFPFRVLAPSPSFTILVLGPLLLWLCCLPMASNSEAEVTTAVSPTDGTGSLASLGTVITTGTSTVPTNLCSTSCVITGGTAAGHNLFHSFGDFNIGASDSARFQTGLVNPLPDPSVSNILARVTGGQSNLFGNLDSATYYPSANLFLMNPAGFLFGPNATVNVGGMMTFTTADSMRLSGLDSSNAGIFHADAAQTSILTSAPVAAFGFIGSNPAAINFEGGQLTVASGTGLALVGGDISLSPGSSVVPNVPSSITAPGRPVQMTSIAGPGEVAADTGIPAAGMALGAVTLGQGTTLSTVGTLAYGDGSGGAVSIRGGQFVATDAKILSSPAIGSTGRGGEVSIATTGSAAITNSTIDTQSRSATGDGGAVSVAASDLALQDSSIVARVIGDSSAITPTTGAGGAVTLTGTDSLTLTRSFINTTTQMSNGNGGAVTVTSPNNVTLEDSNILASASGNESIPVTASGGPVTLGGPETNSVSMTRSGIITESSETEGNSGSVTITGQNIIIGGNGGQQTITTDTHSSSGDPNSGNGGDINITGTNVAFTDSAVVQSVADAAGAFSRGGKIRVNGSQSVLLDNGTVFSTSTVSQGNSGNIELTSQHVTIAGQSLIGSDTFGPGGGGIITITGNQNIALESGSVVTTSAGPLTDGPAGHIELNTPLLTITGGSSVRSTTFGSGPGGTFTIQGLSGPAQSVLISDPGSGVFTDTGSINLDGTIIGTGSGGNIFVHANSVTLQNGGILSAQTTGVGAAGNILVKANSVSLTSGAQLTSNSSLRQTPLFEDEVISPPTGNAGTVTIQGLASPAQSVQIVGPGSGIFTDTQGTGAGGNIFVNANSVTLTNGATVSASSTGEIENPGDAGSIDITATNGFTMQNSTITTLAGQGASGGDIKVTTAPSATVLLEDSRISASVADGQGGGGNISIDPQFVILLNSQILAQAAQGQGGAITIIANLFQPDANSIVNADSRFGVNGTVTIQSPNAPGSGQVQPLGKTPLQATSLLNQHCASLAGGEFSSFTVAGRDSLPTEPGSWLTSPLVASGAGEGLGVRGEGLGTGEGIGVRSEGLGTGKGLGVRSEGREGLGPGEGLGVRGKGLEGKPLGASPADQTTFLSLRQIAPAGFLTQAFALDWSAGCSS